jgi:hypothetical protein
MSPEPGNAYDDPHDPPRRKVARVPIDVEVFMRRSVERSYPAAVHDLSTAGCSLEFAERPRVGESVWIKFEGLEALESIVRWIEGDSAGVEFVKHLHPAVFDALLSKLR